MDATPFSHYMPGYKIEHTEIKSRDRTSVKSRVNEREKQRRKFARGPHHCTETRRAHPRDREMNTHKPFKRDAITQGHEL